MNEPARSKKTAKPILAEGRNCWTARAPVQSAGLVVDGRDYYCAFYEAAQQARRYILLAGWRFNSDFALLRGPDAPAGAEVRFLPFLNQLCDRHPDLHIFILAWDFSIIYAREWELFQESIFQRADKRLQFVFDDQHAVGASHHQKFVVIDGRAAFVGGLDFNIDDWDDRRHLAYNPVREGSGQGARPYHDVQASFTGDAALEVAEYFRERWRKASGEDLALPPPSDSVPTFKPTIALTAQTLALSRNEPKTLNDAQDSYEIRQLYLDAIAAADQLIFIENQYFSSEAVYRALLERMNALERPTLDIVVILPKRFPAWIETAAMGPRRLQMMSALLDVAQRTGQRLGFYYVATHDAGDPDKAVLVHSKVLIVDDRFMTVGSCNTSNRSMGLDTELNVSWEAPASDTELGASIRRTRLNLLAEHTGLPEAELSAILSDGSQLVRQLDRLAAESRSHLRRLTPEMIVADQEWVKTLADWGLSFDPGKAVLEETMHEEIGTM